MAKAYCLIRDHPVYRREAFVRGLRATDLEVVGQHHPPVGAPGDVLITWNRYGGVHDLAVQFEKRGGVVIVAENGYLANDRSNRTRYALAREGHNGSGWWPEPSSDRWSKLGVEIKPWQKNNGHVLVCPNRSFGMPGFIMPGDWSPRTVERLRRYTQREIRLRPHPGNELPRKPLAEDLVGAWAMVIWSSSAGVEALVSGIPVFCTAPWWICKSATKSELADIELPRHGDSSRQLALERLAWAQWHIEEIESGEPFQHLLHRAPAFAGRV